MTGSHDTGKVIQTMVQKIITEYAPPENDSVRLACLRSPGPDSDIDFLIIKETSERFIDRWVTVQRIITGLHPSIPVETLVLTPQEIRARLAIGGQFIKEIIEKDEILYDT